MEVLPGEVANVGDVKMTLSAVEYKTAFNDFEKAADGKTYIIATVAPENAGNRTKPYNSFDFRVQAAGGQVLDGTFYSGITPLNSGDIIAAGKAQEQRKKIDNELEQLETRKNVLFDRWMEGRIKDDHTYESQNERLVIHKAELEQELSELKIDELDKEKIVDEVVRFVAHAGDIWRTAKAENKILFQKLVFDTGLTINPDHTFGTGKLGLIYEQLTGIQNFYEINKAELSIRDSALVHPIRFERTTFGTGNQRSIQLSYGCARCLV